MSSSSVTARGVRPLAVVVGAAILAAGWAGRCRAEGDANALAGRVVDRAGVGVADVSIWAVGGDWEHPRLVGKADTDASGRFVLPTPAEPTRPGDLGVVNVLGIARDGRLGWRLSVRPRNPQPEVFRVVLNPVGPARGRVRDSDGRPVAGAEVVTRSIYYSTPDHPERERIALPPEFAARFRATTDADGSFAIPGVPERAALQMTVKSAEFGELDVYWETAQPSTIVLDRRMGTVEGRLVPPDARGLSGAFELTLQSVPPLRSGGRVPEPVGVFVNRTLAADKDGHFRFDRLPPGPYQLQPTFGPGTPFSAIVAVTTIKVEPGGDVRAEIPLRRYLAVSGRVVDARTGRGIKGVGVRLVPLLSNPNASTDRVETDADGRYTVTGPRGFVELVLGPVPEGYLVLRRDHRTQFQRDGDLAKPDLTLAAAVSLEGVVVDEDGKPVAGARVLGTPSPRGSDQGRRQATTGLDGIFRLDRLATDEDIPLWARTNEATTGRATIVRPGGVADKVTLAIDLKSPFRLRGRVTDRSGRRLAGARVTLWSLWKRARPMTLRPGESSGIRLDQRTTDATGWFVFRGLWPDHQYKVVIEAPGYRKAETGLVPGRPGEAHDFGTFAMAGGVVEQHVDGRVVGSDGRPIAGADVFNRGDAPMPLDARTGPDGRFRLDSLLPGTKYVFVRKDGYRFTGARVVGEADDLTIRLLRSDEPPTAWKPGAGPSYEDQRAFARRVLVRLWQAFGPKLDPDDASACIAAMARLDLDLALRWSGEHGGRFDGKARRASAEELAATDAPGALELLGLVVGSDKQNALQELAERFAATDPKKALIFAEEAAVQARSRPQPERTWALAMAGEVLVRVGRDGAGRRIIDEAMVGADRLTAAAHEGYARAVAARAIAPFDLDRALKLIDPDKAPLDRGRYTAFVADAIAEADPDRASALVDEASSVVLGAEDLGTRIAVRLGPDDPDRAIRMIEGSGEGKYRAEGFAWLAIAVAPRHPARAVALIDRALASPLDRPELFRSWMNAGGRLATAARIAACARRAGYPDMDGVMMRVMACRPGHDGSGFTDPFTRMHTATKAAVPLAVADPDAARLWLEQIEARGGLGDSPLTRTAESGWLVAWSLVDLRKAESLVDAEIARVEKSGGAGLRGGPILRMIDVLLLPPDRREAALLGAEGPPWRPARPG